MEWSKTGRSSSSISKPAGNKRISCCRRLGDGIGHLWNGRMNNLINWKTSLTMNSEQLLQYIRDARIFNASQIEQAAGLGAGTLAKALRGERKLTEQAVKKILFVFKNCGVNPKNASKYLDNSNN